MTKSNEDEGIILPFLRQIINSSRMSASLRVCFSSWPHIMKGTYMADRVLEKQNWNKDTVIPYLAGENAKFWGFLPFEYTNMKCDLLAESYRIVVTTLQDLQI